MEELSLIYQSLSRTGARNKQFRDLYRQIESLVLVSMLALRNAQLRLWDDDQEDRPPSPPSPPSDDPTA
jgi:hypothetical protein